MNLTNNKVTIDENINWRILSKEKAAGNDKHRGNYNE